EGRPRVADLPENLQVVNPAFEKWAIDASRGVVGPVADALHLRLIWKPSQQRRPFRLENHLQLGAVDGNRILVNQLFPLTLFVSEVAFGGPCSVNFDLVRDWPRSIEASIVVAHEPGEAIVSQSAGLMERHGIGLARTAPPHEARAEVEQIAPVPGES